MDSLESSNDKKNIFFITYVDSGKLVNSDGTNSFSFIIEGIEKAVHSHGYYLCFMTVSNDNLERELDRLSNNNCAGFILFAPEVSYEQLIYFNNLDIPFVLLENSFIDLSVSSVQENNHQGMKLAIDYLIQSGHKKIGYLTSSLDYNCFKERQHYAKKILKKYGLFNSDEEFFFPIGYPEQESYEGMKNLLCKSQELPDAFLSDCDLVAIGAIKACKDTGHIVPEDFSFVGFDNLPISSMIEPGLTTIHIYKDNLGTEAVELLMKHLRNTAKCTSHTVLFTTLVERNSVSDIN
ncbi:MAG: substrate-binding domain-containing protein [Eubacteriales bacterium]|nr:substrate-binding domain-containing protein [Eubacteriales bacterium]